MANYPVLSLQLDAISLKQESLNTALPAKNTDGGYTITRAKNTRRPRRLFSFKHKNISPADKTLLEDHWNAMMGSSQAFNWTNPDTSEIINVRFDSGMDKITFERQGYGSNSRWNTGTITLKEV